MDMNNGGGIAQGSGGSGWMGAKGGNSGQLYSIINKIQFKTKRKKNIKH